MIDKIELKVGASVRLTKEFYDLQRYTDRKNSNQRRYHSVLDFRSVGLDLRLHQTSIPNIPNKLETMDSGQHTAQQIRSDIERLVEGDVDCLEIARVDMAADVVGVDMDWFRTHTDVMYKRKLDEYGAKASHPYKLEQSKTQTLTFGRHPNLVRIYDKIAQLRHEYDLLRRSNRNLVFADVLAPYGWSEETTITRVERQFGVSTLPKVFQTFGALLQNAQTSRGLRPCRTPARGT
jgi:hypothetical protein